MLHLASEAIFAVSLIIGSIIRLLWRCFDESLKKFSIREVTMKRPSIECVSVVYKVRIVLRWPELC